MRVDRSATHGPSAAPIAQIRFSRVNSSRRSAGKRCDSNKLIDVIVSDNPSPYTAMAPYALRGPAHPRQSAPAAVTIAPLATDRFIRPRAMYDPNDPTE